jgi:N-acyl-D-amino-acid deacylase
MHNDDSQHRRKNMKLSANQKSIRASLYATLFAALLAGCASSPEHLAASVTTADVIIRNGRIVDGTGNNWFVADLAIRDGKIAAIGKLDHVRAARTIDAARNIVAPGFIDVHAHIEFGLFDMPTTDNYILDGVTTVITGNCGGSADSLKEFFGKIDSTKTSINVASLVGHNTVRRQVLGLANRAASVEEQKRMEALVDQAMKEGAVGLSTGLIYLPGLYSKTEEVIGLARVAAKHHGLYASHMRNEGGKVVEAINEALDIGRAANMPVQISHFKVSAPANWGRSRETLALIEKARADGLDVTIDQYPYTASSTQLSVMLPDWAVEGGIEAIKKLLADPTQRKKIAAEILQSARINKRPDFSYAVVARHAADTSLNGKNLSVINREKGRPPTMEMEIETMLDLIAAGNAQMVFHGMSEDDVRYIMRYPFNMIGADGGVQNGKGMPHPRSYGTNARVLGKYVREEKIISLEDAVRRMTSLAAQKFQLKDRGLLREGYAADIVIFDDKTVIDRATFDNPHQFSAGFRYVLVNGKVTVDDGKHNGARSGIALKGPAYLPAS